MKRHLSIFVMLLATCLPLTAQLTPVQPLAKKLIIAELKQDFRDFDRKVATMNINKNNKAALAAEYSDLIDRMDEAFHNPQPMQKTNVQAVVAQKSYAQRIDH